MPQFIHRIEKTNRCAHTRERSLVLATGNRVFFSHKMNGENRSEKNAIARTQIQQKFVVVVVAFTFRLENVKSHGNGRFGVFGSFSICDFSDFTD